VSLCAGGSRDHVRPGILIEFAGACGLTIHSSRRRFAARLDSGVRHSYGNHHLFPGLGLSLGDNLRAERPVRQSSICSGHNRNQIRGPASLVGLRTVLVLRVRSCRLRYCLAFHARIKWYCSVSYSRLVASYINAVRARSGRHLFPAWYGLLCLAAGPIQSPVAENRGRTGKQCLAIRSGGPL